MASIQKVDINDDVLRGMLTELGQTVCVEHAQRIAAASGAEWDSHKMPTRIIASVYTTDQDIADAILRNLK